MTKTVKKAARADKALTHKAARHDDGLVLRGIEKASELADQPPLIALASATILVGAIGRKPAIVRSGVRMLASHLLATGIKTVLKRSIDRTRPKKALKDGHHVKKGTGAKDSDLNSFPSGHTAGAVAIAQAVAVDAPAAALPVRLVAGAVAVVQMPRGKHYISDVLAGAAIGWASERIASAGLRVAEAALIAGRARFVHPPVTPAKTGAPHIPSS